MDSTFLATHMTKVKKKKTTENIRMKPSSEDNCRTCEHKFLWLINLVCAPQSLTLPSDELWNNFKMVNSAYFILSISKTFPLYLLLDLRKFLNLHIKWILPRDAPCFVLWLLTWAGDHNRPQFWGNTANQCQEVGGCLQKNCFSALTSFLFR